jgi:LCP family protein required for cell wall assembly
VDQQPSKFMAPTIFKSPGLVLISWGLLVLLISASMAGCANGVIPGMAASLADPFATPRPTYVLAPPDSTATPTPFQPLPPTPVNQPTQQPLPVLTATSITETPNPLATPIAEQPLPKPPKQINVLLLGSDRRPWDTGFRTDTIILVTLNSELGRVNITSFPRDLYLNLPGWGMGRINTAWTYGGLNLVMSTFEQNFGVTPDYYILIDFSSFKKIIDGLDGLTVHVAEPVSDYRAGYWITIHAGDVQMDADLVLWYVRTRKTTNDIARNRRQQEVLQALFERLLTLNAIRRAPEFYNVYKDSVKTNVELIDVLSWIPLAAKMAQNPNIHQYFVTYKQVYDWITPDGAMVLVPKQDALMQVIRKSQNLQ